MVIFGTHLQCLQKATNHVSLTELTFASTAVATFERGVSQNGLGLFSNETPISLSFFLIFYFDVFLFHFLDFVFKFGQSVDQSATYIVEILDLIM